MTDPLLAASIAALGGAAAGSGLTFAFMRRAHHLDAVAAFRHPAGYLLLEARDMLREPAAASEIRLAGMLRDADELRRLVPAAWNDVAAATHMLWRELGEWARRAPDPSTHRLQAALARYAGVLARQGLDPVEYVLDEGGDARLQDRAP